MVVNKFEFSIETKCVELNNYKLEPSLNPPLTRKAVLSMTAIQRHGYLENEPSLPGEMKSATRGMERNMKGFQELRQEILHL